MGILTAKHLPLVSATKFNVSNSAAIAAGSGDYGSYTNAGSGDFVLGSSMPKARKLLVVVNSAAVANSPTGLKVALLKGDDANGTNAAATASVVELDTAPAGDTAYVCELDLAGVDDLTKYYSLGLAVNGASSAATVIADAVALELDPTFLTA